MRALFKKWISMPDVKSLTRPPWQRPPLAGGVWPCAGQFFLPPIFESQLLGRLNLRAWYKHQMEFIWWRRSYHTFLNHRMEFHYRSFWHTLTHIKLTKLKDNIGQLFKVWLKTFNIDIISPFNSKKGWITRERERERERLIKEKKKEK